MDQIPWLFLDVDGVVNIWTEPKGAHARKHGPYVMAKADTWSVWYRPKAVERINAISRAGLAKIVWLTTWREKAATELAPAIGLDDFAVAEHDILTPDREKRPLDWWKWDVVNDAMTGQRRGVWLDDDIDQHFRKEAAYRFDGRLLCVTPMPQPGVTDAHFDRIEKTLT